MYNMLYPELYNVLCRAQGPEGADLVITSKDQLNRVVALQTQM